LALARVVEFDGVSSDRMQQMKGEMESGQPPEGMPPAELIVLHDGDGEKSLVVLLLENEDDYRKADEILGGMSSDDTPGQRTSVRKFDVAVHMKN
jgi:hypothetical protein